MLDIEIWSDYTCPYCYIGKVQLKEVLKDMGVEDVRFRHKVYLLEPEKENRPDQTYIEGLGITDEKKKQKVFDTFESIADMAAENGLDYKLFDMPNVTTHLAHRLTLWAEDFGKGDILSDLIFEAYFEKARDISNTDVLCELAREAGLDVAKACDCLTSDAISDRIHQDFAEAKEKEIDLVPHFFFNGDHEVLGVTTPALLKEAVTEALQA